MPAQLKINTINKTILILIIFNLLSSSCIQKKQPETLETKIENNNIESEKINSEENANVSFSVTHFIPENYTILDTTSGDLNLDQFADMIMALKKNGEDATSNADEHPEKRPLLILLGQADNTYKLVARNDNAVYCIDCGGMMGDPFMNVAIKNGYFSIEHYGGSAWRWERIITFKYSSADNNWYLHKDGGDSFHASDPENVTTQIKTTKDFGKISFDKFNIYE
jgi:hypothetical protein